MGMQVVRRGGLLVQMEPGPTLTTNTRETLLPLVATLLLEAGRRPPAPRFEFFIAVGKRGSAHLEQGPVVRVHRRRSARDGGGR